MATVETVGYPISTEDWEDNYCAAMAMFSEKGNFTEPDLLTAQVLTRQEFDHIGSLNGGQIEELQVAFSAIRKSHPKEGLKVATTKVLIKSGVVLLGLADHEMLTTNQFRIAEAVNRVTGVRINERPFKNSVTLGTMIDKSAETYLDVRHTFNDSVIPESLTLGPVYGEIYLVSRDRKVRF